MRLERRMVDAHSRNDSRFLCRLVHDHVLLQLIRSDWRSDRVVVQYTKSYYVTFSDETNSSAMTQIWGVT